MIYSRTKKGIRVAEVWYDNEQISHAMGEKPDIIRCHYMDTMPGNAVSREPLFTILVDLSQSEEDLLQACDKTTRYQINRAGKSDSVVTRTLFQLGSDTNPSLEEYVRFFNDFAQSKGRSEQSVGEYSKFVHAHTLCIRSVNDSKTGEALAMHCYIVSDGKARLHQSSSLFRNSNDKNEQNRIGRVNRFLHMDDMLYFKDLGIPVYDFGGWYGGNSDSQKLAINRFKEAFGGAKHEEFSFILPVTFKGRCSVLFRSLVKGMR